MVAVANRAQLGIAPERGCGEAQPQQLRLAGRSGMTETVRYSDVLRLVSATQPRSVLGAVCGCARFRVPKETVVLAHADAVFN